jgi:O-antigen/teichoic acid export membrane protein
VYGAKWLPSTIILQILAIGGIFAAADGVHEAAIRAVGRASWLSVATLIWSSLTVIGFVATAPYGLPAMAASFVAVNAVTFPVYFWMVAKLLPIHMRDYLRTYVAPCLGTLLMVTIVFLFRATAAASAMPAIVRLGLDVLIGAAAYLTTIYFLARSQFVQLLGYLSALRQKTAK